MSSEYLVPRYEPGPRKVFQAVREAFVAANGRLMGASTEEIAEQLIVGGHLQIKPWWVQPVGATR